MLAENAFFFGHGALELIFDARSFLLLHRLNSSLRVVDFAVLPVLEFFMFLSILTDLHIVG
jgi:hypothetical protein